MNLLFLTAEMAPYAKAGGLGDVVGALPAALRRLGHDARVVMPRYGSIDPEKWNLKPALPPFRFPAAYETITASLLEGERDGVPVYFIEIPWLFGDRPAMYDYGDDPRRFVLFSAAGLLAIDRLGFQPDVVHAHDWHTAITPAMLRGGRGGSFYLDSAAVLTIHNLAYQGWVERASLNGAAAFLPHWATDPWISLFGLGLGSAELVTTVSPTYAREILTPEYGERLDGLLRSRQDRLHGVLNGIDLGVYDPQTDPAIPAHYSAEDLAGKAACKEALQAEAGFHRDPGAPLLGIVSRLVDQKGFDLFAAAAETLLAESPLQVAVLGSGQPHYEHLVRQLEARHPGRVKGWIGFDAPLAHRIYAGADLFLMPSRFEPCGLGQLIAMRYGTVPVVRATGGLADTVQEGPPEAPGTGFVFWEYRADALIGAMRRALASFARPDEWAGVVRNALAADYSWTRAAGTYEALYRQAVALHRPGD